MDHQGIQKQLSKRGIFLCMYYTKPQEQNGGSTHTLSYMGTYIIHKASTFLYGQSFLMMLTSLVRIVLTSLLASSTWPLACGW